ncbi:hypothetical protein [Brevundimonas sp.]|uniref:hypothetical protein n=1 Tax=Brevundimonas sp. TaxID=1871086 RepID=UPI003BA9EA1B
MQAMGERGLWGAAGDAIADIRTKLIDEGWFGRRAASGGQNLAQEWGGPSIHDTPGAMAGGSSFEEAWAVREPTSDGERAQEIGIDR